MRKGGNYDNSNVGREIVVSTAWGSALRVGEEWLLATTLKITKEPTPHKLYRDIEL